MPTNHGIKKYSGLEGGKEFPKGSGFAPIDKVRETWIVVADNSSQTYEDILATPGIPGEGDTRGVMGCKSAVAREIDPDARLWEVDVEWDSRVDGQSQGSDPVNWRPVPRWTSETIELPISSDQVNGRAIENAVGEPFFITTPHSVPVRYWTRYENHDVLDYYDDIIKQYCNRLNASPFRGWPEWTVLLAAIEAEEATILRNVYAKVTYVTKYLSYSAPSSYVPLRSFDSDPQFPVTTVEEIGWRESLLNHGTKYLETAGDPLTDAIPFTDFHGNPTTGNLNVDGTKLPTGGPGVPAPGSGNYLRFFRHKLVDFGPLNI